MCVCVCVCVCVPEREREREREGSRRRRQRARHTGTPAQQTDMDAPKRIKPGALYAAYRLLTRRNSVYVSFIIVGALVGEKVLDSATNKLWLYNNQGKMYEDISVLGMKATGEE
ncbi:hypothetical protein GOP47_0024133 [Adiantum capillus-veneris]|uniref:Cytochrome b-c1 complex subunit 9 n=1 Tax=Adiantum capillus-veneris TaxID=13818 RepID=A0A9D4Z405_ADICA|nr:hypothetical protein GOP47_0024133 [Adiantum capillus-veneris]